LLYKKSKVSVLKLRVKTILQDWGIYDIMQTHCGAEIDGEGKLIGEMLKKGNGIID
jgi:hypothetical protein